VLRIGYEDLVRKQFWYEILVRNSGTRIWYESNSGTKFWYEDSGTKFPLKLTRILFCEMGKPLSRKIRDNSQGSYYTKASRLEKLRI